MNSINIFLDNEYNKILNCKTNYLNAAFCKTMRGKRDRVCLEQETALLKCLEKL